MKGEEPDMQQPVDHATQPKHLDDVENEGRKPVQCTDGQMSFPGPMQTSHSDVSNVNQNSSVKPNLADKLLEFNDLSLSSK